jgi:hypothetical protein
MERAGLRRTLLCVLVAGGCSGRTPDPPARSATRDSLPADSGSTEWRIAPGSTTGPLVLTTSEADLRQRYGAGSVDSTRIQIGEGETMAGAVLYPGDSLRRAEIVWQDSIPRRRPARIILRGSRSRWQVNRGISLGTSLQELERLNGRPFTLAGFGWDYAGVVTDWKGGALDSSLAGVKLYLEPGPAQNNSPSYSQVLGDRDYSSALPAMQQLAPRVYQIFVDFAPASDSAVQVTEGVCPFECCQLGTWTAREPLRVLLEPRLGSPLAFKIDSGEAVRAERGDLHQISLAKVVLRYPTTLWRYGNDSTLTVPAGDTLVIDGYVGEGNWNVSYRGADYSAEQFWTEDGTSATPKVPGVLVQPLRAEWWVRLRNQTDQVGWLKSALVGNSGDLNGTSMVAGMDGADACS